MAVGVAGSTAAAQEVIATWNIGGAQRGAAEIGDSVAALVEEVGALDLLVLQEVISEDQVEAAAEALGVEHWAISDFSPPVSITNNPFGSLEVAVISRTPIARAAEWDTTGRGLAGDDFPPRTSSDLVAAEELPINLPVDDTIPARGFLRVDLASGPSIYAVHWKSSRGESCNAADIEFARQREVQAAGILFDAAQILERDGTVIVAGDFNIQAPGRALRVGVDPSEDCVPTGTCEGVCAVGVADGYDDSIAALLTLEGARLLSADLPETFIGQMFPGGAIDRILVAGAGAGAFETATTPEAEGKRFLGSDHRPVLARSQPSEDRDARARRLIQVDPHVRPFAGPQSDRKAPFARAGGGGDGTAV